jgi:hypothetical protein
MHHLWKAILIADVQCLCSSAGIHEFVWISCNDKMVNLTQLEAKLFKIKIINLKVDGDIKLHAWNR